MEALFSVLPVIGGFPHKDQWRGALTFSLICAWTNGWVNNWDTGDLRCHRVYYDVILMDFPCNEHELETKWTPFRRRHFQLHFLEWNVWIPIKISLKFVPKGPINNIPALVQIMAWCRPGDEPLSELMMVSLLTHICVTRPQCVNYYPLAINWNAWQVWCSLQAVKFKPELDYLHISNQECRIHIVERSLRRSLPQLSQETFIFIFR